MKHFLFLLWCKISVLVVTAILAAALIFCIWACLVVSGRESDREEGRRR